MFYDESRIFIRSGKGGDGIISFWREKFVAYGGPDGGDGGKGGDIVFFVNPKINSLAKFRRNVHFHADPGVKGGRGNCTGAKGDNLILEVPPGTVLRDEETGELIAELLEPNQRTVILKGGAGGKGNSRFASSTNQAPKIAEKGEPPEERWITMELKLIADVGLVGKPNAGKSTLLSVISDAKPKIASYPFTTLKPSLGVVNLSINEQFVVADIPGLIEGASQGIGLGHDFLRHIERTRIVLHLLNGEAAEPLEDWAVINQELSMYDVDLIEKPQLVVLNKMDTADAQAWEPLLKERIEQEGYEFMSISAVTREGLKPLLYRIQEMINEIPEPEILEDELVVIRPESNPDDFTIEQESEDEWRIHGERIEKIAARTYFEFDSTARRFQRVLEEMGIEAALKNVGIEDGDWVYIGEVCLEWQNEDQWGINTRKERKKDRTN